MSHAQQLVYDTLPKPRHTWFRDRGGLSETMRTRIRTMSTGATMNDDISFIRVTKALSSSTEENLGYFGGVLLVPTIFADSYSLPDAQVLNVFHTQSICLLSRQSRRQMAVSGGSSWFSSVRRTIRANFEQRSEKDPLGQPLRLG